MELAPNPHYCGGR